jgi:hypothetical protein
MLRKPWFCVVICVGWICDLQRTPCPDPWVDSSLYGAPFALNAEKLLSAVDTDGGTGEVNEDADGGWEARISCVGDGGWVVSDEGVDLVGSRVKIVIETETCSVSIC